MGKKLRQFNRATHRDLGYFFVFLILIYSISGIAINHLDDWNPNYYVDSTAYQTQAITQVNEAVFKQILDEIGIDNPYRSYFEQDAENVKVFVKNGSLQIHKPTGRIQSEILKRRPILHTFNWLHYNPNAVWKWFSDIFAVALIILAISGMFILKGPKGLKWRGTILIALGVILPVVFLLYFYF
jgi:hypothetical protein